jgi:uncharacterized membrane protein YhaH (DUF805 family)
VSTVSAAAKVSNLVLNIVAFVVIMVLALQALGAFGVGSVELLIWLALLVGGIGLLVRRFRRARVGQRESVSG